MKLALYLIVMAGMTYLIRALPFTLFRKPIRSRFLQDFLYYIPYAVIAAMAFPAILYSTGNVITAAVGMAVAVVLSLLDSPLIVVALLSAVSAFLTGLLI